MVGHEPVGFAMDLYRGLRVGRLDQTPVLEFAAARLRVPPIAAFSGRSAAWLHGLDLEPCDPIEMTLPARVSARSGLAVSRAALPESDVVIVHGYRATSIIRTLRDICSRECLTEAVVTLDMALHSRIVDLASLGISAATSSSPGVVNFRRAVTLAEPNAESPMESRLRMLLVLGGLPRPQAQIRLFDSHGIFLGRPDLYYPDQRLALEYDGANHRDRLAEDNRRQNRLLANDFRLLRFTAADIRRTPYAVVAQVAKMLTG